MKKIFLMFILLYQKGISPYTPSSCKFTPTCSQYAYEAIARFGALSGSWLAIRRISKCHPFNNKCGYDPVPEKKCKITKKESRKNGKGE